jgi:hypothetical protein
MKKEIGKGYRSSTKGRMMERWSADAVVAAVTIGSPEEKRRENKAKRIRIARR